MPPVLKKERLFIYLMRVFTNIIDKGNIMLTTKYVRDHLDEIRESLDRRKSDYPLGELLELDARWRSAKTELQALKTRKNRASMEISSMKKEGKESAIVESAIGALSEIKEKERKIERELPAYEERIEHLLLNMPNTLHKSVPYGTDDSQNVEIRKWGEREKRDGKSHEEILTGLGLIDLERAAKVAGARFYYLKGEISLLEQSLIRFALDELAGKGYTAISPPMMMKREMYKGVTSLGDFEDALYRVADTKEAAERDRGERMEEELFLISTSEHAIAAMHAGEVFSAKELPLRYAGVSPCFRREAGSHGKDTKGIFRVHQFYKVEQFIFAGADDSYKFFDELISNSEDIYKKLGIPYRVVDICTGDIGIVAARKNDIEGYMPGQDRYRELVSCSNCTDWQSLRLDIKYDDGGERKFVHTLNSTAIATTRTIVAIVENYANGDGTIEVPKALVKYMGKERIGKPKSQA